MEKTFNIIREMCQENLFSRYAVAGGMAALFYIEPVTTFDLDIFILIHQKTGSIISLSPIYQWLEKRGFKPEGEQVVIEGIPVQFIPAYNKLIEEAVSDSVEKPYGSIKIKVLRPEDLIAVMAQTGRPKDRERLMLFLEEAEYSKERLNDILIRHQLKEKFDSFTGPLYGR